MSEVDQCSLCSAALGIDFTTLGSQSYIETLEFLKGAKTESKNCRVCLICFDKINFVSSFRSKSKTEDDKADQTNSVSHEKLTACKSSKRFLGLA